MLVENMYGKHDTTNDESRRWRKGGLGHGGARGPLENVPRINRIIK